MADNEPQKTFMGNRDFAHVSELTDVKYPTDLQNKNVGIAPSDILQRAFDEAGGYDQSLLNRSSDQNIETQEHLTDHSYIHTNSNTNSSYSSSNSLSLNSLSSENDKTIDLPNLQFPNVSNVNNLDSKSSLPHENIKVSLSETVSNILNVVKEINVSSTNSVISSNSIANTTNSTILHDSINKSLNGKSPTLLRVLNKKTESSPSNFVSTSSPVNITSLKLPPKQTNAPLGSVENPIQIIHNGNSYHSTQSLTEAQLQQITHVLQQSQAKKLANCGSSILFEPNTRTRIVCRVVHPSELQKKSIANQEIPTNSCHGSSVAGRGRGRPKKAFSRKLEDKKQNSLLSKEEKEEKKKHRPRTRSGRISKPPSYMVKDYKRLHHLNFNDEIDDKSDGGYSDYQVSDEEDEKRRTKAVKPPAGVTTAKSRNNKCPSCNKAYIGRGGLSRHYQICHGRSNVPEGGDISTQDENSNSSLASSILSSSGGNTNSQSNLLANPSSARPDIEIPSTTQQTSANLTDFLLDRRKSRLKELLNSFSTSELVDALLPKFAQDVPLWNFFALKCHKESDGLSMFEMLKEFEKFLIQLQRVSLSCLSPATEADLGKTIINISSKQIAEALSLERGSYAVNDDGNNYRVLKLNNYRLVNSDTMPEVSDHILNPCIKRKRVETTAVDVSAGLSEQILSEAPENNNFDIPMSEENISENASVDHQETHYLNVSSTKESSGDIIQKNLFDLKSSTVVTPSSLSSGCLSAINSTNFQKRQGFVIPNDVTPAQSMQVKKVRILSSSVQNQVLTRLNTISALNSFPVSSNCHLNDLATQALMKDNSVTPTQDELGSRSGIIENKMFPPLNLGPTVGIFNSCTVLSQASALDTLQCSTSNNPSTSFINTQELNNLKTDSLKISAPSEVSENLANCLVVADLAQSLENPLTSVNDCEMQTCIPADAVTSSSHGETRFQITSNEILPSDVSKSSEPTVLRQLILPNGQVIGIWSTVGSSEKSTGDHIMQEYLPSNLIIVQNSDGSLQVPQNQGSTLETLQALATVASTTPEQANSLTHTSVNM